VFDIFKFARVSLAGFPYYLKPLCKYIIVDISDK